MLARHVLKLLKRLKGEKGGSEKITYFFDIGTFGCQWALEIRHIDEPTLAKGEPDFREGAAVEGVTRARVDVDGIVGDLVGKEGFFAETGIWPRVLYGGQIEGRHGPRGLILAIGRAIEDVVGCRAVADDGGQVSGRGAEA